MKIAVFDLSVIFIYKIYIYSIYNILLKTKQIPIVQMH